MISVNPSDCRQELVGRLDILRRNQSFCDMKVVVKDKELAAHKAVLAAASPFFLSLLTSDMRESKEHLIRIELEEATASVMEDVLQYIYTGNVSVTEENAHHLSLIVTADYLLLPGLKAAVSEYLIEILTTENCVFYYYFADKYQCMHLKERAREKISTDFSAVMETDDFRNLDIKQVMEWVSSDDITVIAEEEVFKGIVKWVSHNRREREVEFPELLRQVRLVSISHNFLLNKLVKEELVSTNSVCLNFVLDCMRLMCSATDEQVVQQPRKCLELQHMNAIFVCGGSSTLCYLPEQNEWYKLANKPFQPMQISNPSQYRDKIYISSVNVHVSLMEFYIPSTNCWGAFQVESFSFNKTAVLKDYLYATAEAWDGEGSLEIYRYNPENGCCKDLKKPPTNLFDSCVVTDVKYIYLIGGKSEYYFGGTSLSTTYRFDPSADDHEWEEVAPINQARYNAFGAAMNGKVYIAGGRVSQRRAVALDTCEVYNPLTNEWQLMPSLKVPRMSASMVCHEGRLYVLGGVDINWSRVLSVETLDSERNEWRERSVIPVDCFETTEKEKQKNKFRACSARLSKEVIVKLEPLKN